MAMLPMWYPRTARPPIAWLMANERLTSGRPAMAVSDSGVSTLPRFPSSRICRLSTMVDWSSRMNAPDRLFQYVRTPASTMSAARHQRPRGAAAGGGMSVREVFREDRRLRDTPPLGIGLSLIHISEP